MTLAAADPWHDAERAIVIAARDDAHVMTHPGPACLRQGLTLRIVVASRQLGDEILVITDRHHRVELRKAAPQLLPFLGDDAAGDRDGAPRSFPRPQLVQFGVDAVLRRLAHHARVEDGDIGSLERVFDVTGGEQPPRQAFGIGCVHLTADGPDVERPRPHGRRRNLRQRLSTRRRIPVRSSPSIEMSMKAGMQTRSSPPGATYPREIAIAFTAWLIAPPPLACTSTRPLLRITPAIAPATATGL